MMRILLRIAGWMLVAVVVFWTTALYHFVHIIPRNSVGTSVSTDAIVVLTGGSLRVAYGFELLDQGKAKRLLISGVGKAADMDKLLDENNASDAIRALAVDDAVIELDYNANSTRSNAIETADWMKRHGLRSLRLVTANYHVPRSLIEFNRVMPQLIIIADPVFPEPFTLDGWWRDPVSRTLIISEFHKFLAVWLLWDKQPTVLADEAP